MKKFDLVHTAILIVAILCGYAALQQLLYLISSFSYTSDLYYGKTSNIIFPNLFQAALFSIACLILIRNGKKSDFFTLFKDQVRADLLKRPPYRDYLAIDLLRATVGAILLYAAAPLTNFIVHKIAVRLDSLSKSR
jgi:hypothetical protein